MTASERQFRSYVKLFVPTRDRLGNKLSKQKVFAWRRRAERLFREHVEGYYYYRITGAYRAGGGDWIKEPIWVITAFAPEGVCRFLIDALKADFIQDMRRALDQDEIGVESDLEGFKMYR